MAEDDMTGDSVIVDSSSVTTSSSSSNDSDQRRKSNKSSSRKGEEDVDSQVTQKPPLPNSGDEAERNRRLGSSTEAPSEGIVNRQAQDEERPKARRQGKGRIRELEELKAELAEKEVELLEKERELLQQEQTLIVLQEELEIERKIRALVTKEKEEAEEEAALAMGLCVGGSMLP